MKKKTLPVVMLFGMTSFAQTTNPAPYCDASFDDMDGFPVADAIKNVTLGTLTNNSGGQYDAPHYVFYNNLTAPDLQRGTSYPLALAFDVHGGCGYGVWIDYNHNNTFDANEKIAGNAAGAMLDLSDNTLVNTTFTIPANAQTGPTRMRVRIVEDDNYNIQHDFVPSPCNAGTTATDIMDWGETEDYMINITGGSSVGLEEIINAIKWNMDETQLRVTGAAISEMQLFDLNGQCVRSSQTTELEITGIPTGLYLLKIVTADGLILDYKITR